MSRFLNRTSFGNPENKGNLLSREEAEKLLREWVSNEKLILHMRQVAHLMKTWALTRENLSEEASEAWYQAGLLHDADWEKYPDEHCSRIIEKLESLNIDPAVIQCIASHGPAHFGFDPVTKMDKMIYAFDELSGFIHAVSLLRPTGYERMEIKTVKKRLKTPSFAAQVSREDIQDAAQRAGIELDELIQFVIDHQLRK